MPQLSICRATISADAPSIVRVVFEHDLLLRRRHQPEEIARLRVVIGVLAVIPAIRRTSDRQRRSGEIRLRDPFALAVRLVGGTAPAIAVDPHLVVAMIAVERTFGRIHRHLGVIDAEAIALVTT